MIELMISLKTYVLEDLKDVRKTIKKMDIITKVEVHDSLFISLFYHFILVLSHLIQVNLKEARVEAEI